VRDAQTAGQEATMGGTVAWIVLGVLGCGLGMLMILVLCQMAGNQDRAARHAEKKIFPSSDVTITRFGDG